MPPPWPPIADELTADAGPVVKRIGLCESSSGLLGGGDGRSEVPVAKAEPVEELEEEPEEGNRQAARAAFRALREKVVSVEASDSDFCWQGMGIFVQSRSARDGMTSEVGKELLDGFERRWGVYWSWDSGLRLWLGLMAAVTSVGAEEEVKAWLHELPAVGEDGTGSGWKPPVLNDHPLDVLAGGVGRVVAVDGVAPRPWPMGPAGGGSPHSTLCEEASGSVEGLGAARERTVGLGPPDLAWVLTGSVTLPKDRVGQAGVLHDGRRMAGESDAGASN